VVGRIGREWKGRGGEGRGGEERKGIPPHHDAEAPDLLHIQRRGIFLRSSAICGVETAPRDEYGLVLSVVRTP
jgi:hypothetical protein